MTTDKPKPRRRWLQFSLRTLFLVVMVLCVWLAVITKQTRDQRLSVEAIRKVGGDVVYAHVLEQSDPPGPGWLRRLIGDEYFFSVSILELNHSEVGDRDLAAIMRLTNIKRLYISNPQITDAGLLHLQGLTELRVLDLGSTQTTDAGLEYLRELTNLRELNLPNTQVTDEGVENLQQALPYCQITR